MKIKIIEINKEDYLDILLLADPQKDMIERYLADGVLFALYDDDLRCVCVILPVSADECEVKNLAVYEKYQRMGYGRRMLEYVADYCRGKFKRLILGTGEVPSTLSFYNKCGFLVYDRKPDFFTDNYAEPIIEEGILLKDMIYLRKIL